MSLVRPDVYRVDKNGVLILWLKKGDANSKFFHASTNMRFKNNYIGFVIKNGSLITDPGSIKDEALNHFKTIFQKSRWSGLSQKGLL